MYSFESLAAHHKNHVEFSAWFLFLNPDLQTGHGHGIIIAKTKDVPNHVKEGEVKQK